MSVTSTINYTQPDPAYWERYTHLWQNSKDRSPFKSPAILQYFAEREKGHLFVFQCFKNEELIGAVILKGKNGTYSFLSDLKTDVNFFVLHRACTPEDVQQFFEHLIDAIRREHLALVLNNQPSWASYMPVFEAVGKASGMFWLNFQYSVSPLAVEETAEALFKRVNGSRELRYRVNKLKNQENALFEALIDDTEIDLWADEFCDAHIQRWAPTPTPSSFQDPARRQFLKDCLHAWNKDGLLVRFSVKVKGKRIGFVVGLREENSLVHHSTTFHPDYWKFSPGKALIHFMTEWMQEHHLHVLDFGDGNEPYKYEVADQEHILNRIFISSRRNVKFMLKSKAIKLVKEHPKMYDYYQNKLKRRLVQAASAAGLSDLFSMLFA